MKKKLLIALSIFFFITIFSAVAFAGTNDLNWFAISENFQVAISADGQFFFCVSDLFAIGDTHTFTLANAKIIISLLQILLAFFYLSIKKSFFIQGSKTMLNQPVKVLASGILMYGGAIALIVVFMASVIAFPIAGVIFLMMILSISLAETAFSIMISELLADKVNMSLNIYESVLIGTFGVECIKYIPYGGWVFEFICLPIIALGIFYTTLVNAFVYKTFYISKYDLQNKKPDNRVVRDILLNKNKM